MAKNDQTKQAEPAPEEQTLLAQAAAAEEAAAKERQAVLDEFYATGKVRPGFSLQFRPGRGNLTEPVVTKLG